ncbi:bifunctional oligoribonuclease/PAP phosphatase NrnA [Terrilactibacillus sp. BCM23-1]|uniref:Bifunctional oligoribonuclease/PAP phosphatase NrnA n=1 Tax=Terrilactibacillus tamarindi TaxID=2599694 RepID=A0A6N8CPS4_9BACI|nr:bifunctional oligoribonuclease/PAP phosphatase NrnA [Terrilactibacillus tamarindi]MTT31658.1 bifunctional oligoribonuclease/PAP phosphatase NrnA [Terrilactibacillus tamarindi]
MIEDILACIKEYETIIIHRHIRPDPDALGSQGGLQLLIKDNYPGKKVYVVGEEVPSLMFLNRMDIIDDSIYQNALVIVCDTANQDRVSDNRYHLGQKLIKIDHHPVVDQYGDIQWVDTTASSVSEMIASIYLKKPELTLSAEAARLLYAGIIGDTGRFLFPNATPETFHIVSQLVAKPFSRQSLYESLYKSSLAVMHLKGYVLQHFDLNELGLGSIRLTREVLDSFQVNSQEASQLVSAFSDVENLKVWVVFVQEEDQIRARIRSKGPKINTIAGKYHGGGHPLASGATVYSWEEADSLMRDLNNLLN